MLKLDWATSTDPQAMQSYLRGAITSDRKYRLFACACCRRIWDEFPDQRNRDLVVAVEDHPDGKFEDPEIHGPACASAALEHQLHDVSAYWVVKALGRGFYKMTADVSAAVVSAKVLFLTEPELGWPVEDAIPRLTHLSNNPVSLPTSLPTMRRLEAAAQAAILRDIFGNPFRQTHLDDTWRSETVVSLASQMYETRDFSLMAVLGDALQDVGCADENILEHCRGTGPHSRGCWLVDLILRKS